MSLPEINFENIRPYDGSRHAGFEELCSQLAYIETPPTCKFCRKGRGGDAGVECYRQEPDGTEIGFQAKYLFSWDNSIVSQLNESIRTALDKHLQLVEYVICLPFDLSDSRTGRGKTAREKWNDWCEKWKHAASVEGRPLTITLWGKSELTVRLSKDNAAHGGRVLYWFGREAFTYSWFVDQFEKVKATLGARYTPETNVELLIRQNFLGFARDQTLQQQLDRWFIQVSEEGHSTVRAIRNIASAGSTEPHSEALGEGFHTLAVSLDTGPIGTDKPYPLDKWISAAKQCENIAKEALYWVYELPAPKREGSSTDPKGWAQHCLHKALEVLSDIENAVASPRWQLANARCALLTGPAGIGKSHLLADIVDFQIHEGRPAILVLGSMFTDEEPWHQILSQLDRPGTEQVKHFLGAMDAAAQATNARALICIDALNERNGIDVWPHRLASFLKTIEAFPRIGVILSCRSTYVEYVIPDNLSEDQLYRVEHEGFADDDGKAANVYLDKRGIVRPGAPNLVPEFENPLFLKTCCDFLEKEGKTELPRGLRGVTSIFGFYNAAVTRALNQSMKLDPHFEIVPKAIDGFALLLTSASQGYIGKAQTVAFFESVRPSGGSLEKSLLSQLVSEGMLTIEPIRQCDGTLVEMVRFTFERFSDHMIADRLLHKYLKKEEVASSFQTDQPLNEFVFGTESYRRAGIIEAMAVQLAEQTGVEILDVVVGEISSAVHRAFLESLLWREQSHFTDRTFKLAQKLLPPSDFNDLLISISTEPLNKFNARYVHTQLLARTMPERDAFWSVYLAERGYEGQVETLISWAIHNGLEHIDEDRAYLAATMLAWFFTTSHRIVRDKATKGLACILSRRLSLAARVLNDFAAVNDPYLSERLLAACYGAALQGSESGLSELAQAVFDLVFSDGKPPVDALLRDHAHCIVEYARWRDPLACSIDVRLSQPPYMSPWPIEPVPDELIASYTIGTLRDAIVGSTVNDGDFARYQLDYLVAKWSPAPFGTTSLPSSRRICASWLEEFSSAASAEQLDAFKEYTSAAEGAKDTHGYQKTPETARVEAAETALKGVMSSDQWEDFRVRAKDFIRHELFTDWYRDQPATFNIAWCRRWVCKRAHEHGWTTELFGDFERNKSGYDRYDHKVERIGKKYQWVALRELIAHMADNLVYIGNSWESNGEMPGYRGARQIGIRDIDPSLLTTETHYDGWAEWGRTWWVPFNPELRAVSPHERRAWLESDSDIINDASLIDLRNPKTGRRWLQLSGFAHWRGLGVCDGSKEFQRETWFRLNCIVVRRADQTALVDFLRNQTLTDPHSLPKIELHGEFYLGEYPWHPELLDIDRWSSPENGWRSMPVPTRATVATYTCERGNYDFSIDRTVSIEIPAPWLALAMELRLSSGRSPVYVDTSGREVFYDPSVVERGPAAALVDRDAFLQLLGREGLSAVWVIAGEKSAYGGRDIGLRFGGRLLHTAIYQVVGDGFSRHFHRDWTHPSKAQLAEFFGE
ncbi:MAG: ATP-binding protein [Proteobacteria bacterium]|nr:ATP-binding protein [Pseudomonadota bacterium]MCG2750697.1 ATP-binding protein [Desulfobacteraceae bacterium]